MRNMIKNMRSPIKCRRTAQDNLIPDALEAHIFIGLNVSEFSSFMALKGTASHDYVLQFIFIN